MLTARMPSSETSTRFPLPFFEFSQDVFPQLMGRAVIVNLPSFFSALFVLFKSFMSKRTQVCK